MLMKKLKLLSLIAVLAAFISCEKDWSCDCVGANGVYVESYEFRVYEENAQESCLDTENNWKEAFGSDSECKLREK